jgi:hypothetical protein
MSGSGSGSGSLTPSASISDPLGGDDSPIQEDLLNKYATAAQRTGGSSGFHSPSAGPSRPLSASSDVYDEESQGQGELDNDNENADEEDDGIADNQQTEDSLEQSPRRSGEQSEEDLNESFDDIPGDDFDEPMSDKEQTQEEEEENERESDYEEVQDNQERKDREMPAILSEFIRESVEEEEENEETKENEQLSDERNLDKEISNEISVELLQAIDREDIRTVVDLQRAREERDHLIEVNKSRQRTVAAILEREKQSKSRSFQGGLGMADGPPNEQARQEYLTLLDQLSHLWAELEQKREEAESKIDTLTARLDSSDEKCTELAQTFKQFKREISKEARNSRTNKGIKFKRILALEAEEEQKDRFIAEQRLKHLHLYQEIQDMEKTMKEKEKLADGLHLIDFEQLKIENQTLNEKIEERNDELHKLRKKTTSTVQVLTHIKEKVTFLRSENQELMEQLDGIQGGVNHAREELTQAKRIRDQLRAENLVLKEKQGFIGSDLLVNDFEGRKMELDKKQKELNELRKQWEMYQRIVERGQAVAKVVEEKKKYRELFPGSGTFVPMESTQGQGGRVPGKKSATILSSSNLISFNEGNYFATRGFQGHKKFSATATMKRK